MSAASGTGYGGQKDDTKRLLAGRKKAERASSRDDKANLRFLRQVQKQIHYQAKTSSGGPRRSARRREPDVDLDERDKTKVAAVLKNTFQNQVPSDWDKRKDVLGAALALARDLATNETLGKILGEERDPEGVLFWLLDFREQAEQILKHHVDRSGEDCKADRNDKLLATQVSETAAAALAMSRRCQSPKQEEELSFVSLRERYQSQLGPLRFDGVDSMRNHLYLVKVPTPPPSLDARRLFKELSSYRRALPVEYGSSCFCRVLNSRLDLLRVMITGPDDTPYANGAFFFDVHLPAAYPRVPPLCQFLTTGGGKVRFNPNLYNCGKVCLSLLGTWQGPGWISGQSTLLQVLISIQSLILVPDPYFNEPCYERAMGTAQGKAQSKAYNKNIRKHTLSIAIESPLVSILDGTNQYGEFEAVMIKHFLEKSSLVQRELWSWVKEDASLVPHCSNVCDQLARLADRERGPPRAKRFRGLPAMAKKARRSDELIVLDNADGEESVVPRDSGGAAKSVDTVEIDLSEDEEEGQSSKDAGSGLIDLTG